MFEKVEVLDKNKHIDFKFNPTNSYFFAKNLTMAPLSYTELVRSSKYYPIIFPSQEDSLIPHALLSIKQGQNAFVDSKGKWTVPYVPAHIRRYPFILGKTDQQGNYALCIDPEAPHFSKEQGEPLYTANGEPTDILNRAKDFLRQYQQEIFDTENLFVSLQDQEILANKQFTFARGENKSAVQGFRAVDIDKLKELSNQTLGSWVKQGVLGLIYAHLHSLDNVRILN